MQCAPPGLQKLTLLCCGLMLCATCSLRSAPAPVEGLASWYGEAHRGKPMADGNKFDPNKMTAASWFYPLGTRVRVSVRSRPQRSVLVTITDRGPAKRLVRRGRIIDLARAAFAQIARLKVGLVHVSVQPIERQRRPGEPGCTAVVEEAGPRGRVAPLRHFKWKP